MRDFRNCGKGAAGPGLAAPSASQRKRVDRPQIFRTEWLQLSPALPFQAFAKRRHPTPQRSLRGPKRNTQFQHSSYRSVQRGLVPAIVLVRAHTNAPPI